MRYRSPSTVISGMTNYTKEFGMRRLWKIFRRVFSSTNMSSMRKEKVIPNQPLEEADNKDLDRMTPRHYIRSMPARVEKRFKDEQEGWLADGEGEKPRMT